MDGTTDMDKEEIMAMVYCYKNEVAQEMTSCTRYWSVHSPQKSDANGLLVCLGASLELLGVKSILDRDSVLGVDGMPVLIGASSVGASVSVAEHNGGWIKIWKATKMLIICAKFDALKPLSILSLVLQGELKPDLTIHRSAADDGLWNLLTKHVDLFKDELGLCKGVKATIHVDETVQPLFFRHRSVPHALKARIEEEINKLEKAGIIEPVAPSEWAAPVVPLVKQDGSIRLCGDYKLTVNRVLKLLECMSLTQYQDDILHRPIQPPCQTVVSTDCLAQYLVQNGCLQCPCKGCCTKMTADSLKSTPRIYVNLLEDVALHCFSCNVDIRAGFSTSISSSIINIMLTTNELWLKGSGICLASERKQRQLAAALVGDNLDAEIAPFTFLTASRNEEIRGAPHAFIPRLQHSVFDLFKDNARADGLADPKSTTRERRRDGWDFFAASPRAGPRFRLRKLAAPRPLHLQYGLAYVIFGTGIRAPDSQAGAAFPHCKKPGCLTPQRTQPPSHNPPTAPPFDAGFGYLGMGRVATASWLLSWVPGTRWVTYDRLYRRQAAASRTLSWAVEDQTLYNEAFSSARPLSVHRAPAKPAEPPTNFQGGSTPFRPEAWSSTLATHPDPRLHKYLVEGISSGFQIGFSRSQPLLLASANMPSAVAHPDVVSAFITNEHRLNRILGPLPESMARLVQCNRLGVVPKGHTPGKWRLITDLSFPSGRSVNDGIDPTLCSLSYVSVDTVSAIVSALGTGSLLAKIDIEAAYRLVPVHPDDRPLLGLRWNGEVYCDAMLPFGLSSAAKIFNALADALEWTIRQKGATHIAHYLDNFVIVGAPDSSQSLNVVTTTCRELGVPLSTSKCEGPTTCLTFLGIKLDTMAGTIRLPSDKLSRVQAVLQAWGDKKTCLTRELESLVGLLHHTCKWHAAKQVACCCENAAVVTALSSRSCKADRRPAAQGSRLAVSDLDGTLRFYYVQGLAESTHRTYQSGMRRFYAFCDTYSIPSPFPVSECTLCYFTTFLANDMLSAQTIKTYLSAVRNMQISLGFPDPRAQAAMLRRAPTPSDSRAQLNWGDITFNHAVQPTMIKVHLSFAKCDQFGRGADIYIGLSGNVICPVAATLAITAIRGTSAGPFFRTKGGRPLQKSHFIAEVRQALAALSLSFGDYAGHSFRIGAATAAAAAGIQDSTIQTLGRWSSAAFLTHVRTPRQDLATVSAIIARIA
eukprot:Em0006g927a